MTDDLVEKIARAIDPVAWLVEARSSHRQASLVRARDVLSVMGDHHKAQAERIAALEAALTPSAETKAAYTGEFTFIVLESHEDDDGDQVDYEREFTVPWDTLKDIMTAIRARADQPK